MNQESKPAPHRVIVVGGGAGGLELATRLGNTLGRRGRVDILLIDATLTHLWKPLLHEVAAGTLNSHEDELSYLAQAHWHHFRFRLGRVESVDREARTVTVAPNVDDQGDEYIPTRTFPYDTLVMAVGSISNDFGIKGVAENCSFLDRRAQADEFHRNFLRCWYAAQSQHQPLRPGQLHVAIAGAGATGVELAAELYNSVQELVGYGLDRFSPEEHVKITIIEAADRILPGLPHRLSGQVADQLQRVGIEIATGQRISEASPEGFTTDDGHFIPAEIKIWAAGIKAPDFLKDIPGLEVNRINQLLVERSLQTTRDENIFALGDCAACPMGDGDTNVPPRAQAAHQQATHMARIIALRLENRPLPDYRYVDYGSLINLSRYSTVGSLMGNVAKLWSSSVFVEGVFARLVYLSLYKMHQFALHGFMRVALMTLANLLTRRTRPRLKLH